MASKTTLEDVLKSIEENNVEFVRFEQTSIYGVSLHRLVPARHFKTKAEGGINFPLIFLVVDPKAVVVPGTGTVGVPIRGANFFSVTVSSTLILHRLQHIHYGINGIVRLKNDACVREYVFCYERKFSIRGTHTYYDTATLDSRVN